MEGIVALPLPTPTRAQFAPESQLYVVSATPAAEILRNPLRVPTSTRP